MRHLYKLVGEVNQIHEVPLQQWIENDVMFKFCGDNVDKKRGVRDVRSDNQATILHMYSLLVGRSHIPGISLSRTGQVAKVSPLPSECFLPTQSDVNAAKENLVVLVSRILTCYIFPHFQKLFHSTALISTLHRCLKSLRQLYLTY